MAHAETQPEPAEGARKDGGPQAEHGKGEGVSSEKPAEGADDVAPPTKGSPRG